MSVLLFTAVGLSNICIGMFLEVATTLETLLGAYLTTKVFSHFHRYRVRCGAALCCSFSPTV